jgi:hypothetical protein
VLCIRWPALVENFLSWTWPANAQSLFDRGIGPFCTYSEIALGRRESSVGFAGLLRDGVPVFGSGAM